jgi:hypothetical protein
MISNRAGAAGKPVDQSRIFFQFFSSQHISSSCSELAACCVAQEDLLTVAQHLIHSLYTSSPGYIV